MADGTAISWAEATWNVITGCEVISPGCKRCYAMRLAGGRLKNHPSRQGLTIATPKGAVWNGEVRFNEDWLDQPLRWRRPRMIFVCAHADLFYERVPDEWIRRVFEVMFQAHHHIFMVLTKRTDRMRAFLQDRAALRNVWIGASVEDQPHLEQRGADLLATPAALHWLSVEPMLGPVDASGYLCEMDAGPRVGWVVAGGESQDSDRPTHPDWLRSLRDQCQAAAVPFHFKQWGDWRPDITANRPSISEASGWCCWPDGTIGAGRADQKGGLGFFMEHVGAKAAGRMLDGRIWDEFPERISAR